MTETTTPILPRLNPYIVFVLPLVVYMLGGMFESSAPAAPDAAWWKPGADYYPAVYGGKTIFTMLAILFVARGYPAWRWPRFTSLLIGVVGVPIWIGLAELQSHSGINAWFGDGQRIGYNPWQVFAGEDLKLWVFLMFRFTGLALVVPVAEEMFLRGFVMRYPQSERWWTVPWGQLDRAALIFGTVLPMAMHPNEALAAFVWFGMIHWLYARTRNIWDCVAAHAITNLGLAIYIVRWEQWQLW